MNPNALRMFVAALLLSMPVLAWSAGDPLTGQARAAGCQGCHGADGNSFTPMFPRLAGQTVDYLKKQLTDFKSGARKDSTMAAFVMALSDQDIQDIAAWYASQKPAANTSQAPAERLQRGRKLYLGGDSYKKVPACSSCHGPEGHGIVAAGFPALAGQHAAYSLKQLKDFAAGSRDNDANRMMRDIASRLSPKEIEALAEYMATLK